MGSKKQGLTVNNSRLPATIGEEQLNLLEKWEVAKEKANANGRVWIVTVDAMIEDGILKKRFR